MIVNGEAKAWFYPSKGLNVLFFRARPKPRGIKTPNMQGPNPTPNRHLQLSGGDLTQKY
jgi:hypothetical protein